MNIVQTKISTSLGLYTVASVEVDRGIRHMIERPGSANPTGRALMESHRSILDELLADLADDGIEIVSVSTPSATSSRS